MKILSIIVPCYNSESYMQRAVDSLLIDRKDIEIILVDDGSKDKTFEIAKEYQKRYPKIIRAVHQENGGHGQAVNTGLLDAKGQYVKVLDSDDWLDKSSFEEVLDYLGSDVNQKDPIDMLISNYVYDKQGVSHKKVMNYARFMPKNKVFGWDEVKFTLGKYLLMHSVIYRKDILLNDAKIKLPKHTFYVDNIYVFEPLPFVHSMYYLDVDLYHYYIGREDQSVNEKIMIGRIDQQLKVNRLMIDYFSNLKDLSPSLKDYMFKYLEIITTVSSILLIKSGTRENLKKKHALWEYIKEKDSILYHELRWGLFGTSVNLPWKIGRKTAINVYRLARMMYGFN